MGLAYKSGSNDIIISMLMKIKAEEFRNSPHSPYAPSSVNTSIKEISVKNDGFLKEETTKLISIRNRCDSRESFDSFSFTTRSNSFENDPNNDPLHQQLETRDILNLQSPIHLSHIMRTTSEYSIGITESFIAKDDDDDDDDDNDDSDDFDNDKNKEKLLTQQQQQQQYDDEYELQGELMELSCESNQEDGLYNDSIENSNNIVRQSNKNTVSKRSFHKIRKVASKAVNTFLKPLSSNITVSGMPPRPPLSSAASRNKINIKYQ